MIVGVAIVEAEVVIGIGVEVGVVIDTLPLVEAADEVVEVAAAAVIVEAEAGAQNIKTHLNQTDEAILLPKKNHVAELPGIVDLVVMK